MEQRWVSLKERVPGEADGDPQKCVLVWHELSGCLIWRIENIPFCGFLTHWMRLPDRPETGFGGGPYGDGEGASGGDQPQVH